MNTATSIRCFRLCCLTVLLTAGGSAAASASPGMHPDTRIVTDLIRDTGAPALAVTMASGGRIIWSKAYGYADLENRIHATVDTPMRIGSISKTMTATAVARAARAGVIDVDRPVRSYLPMLPQQYDPITLRELGGHLSGIRTYLSPAEHTGLKHYDSPSEALGLFIDDPLANPPGTKFLYTSYGFVLLSAAAERAAGRSFRDFVDAYVWKPLHLAHTSLDDFRAIIPGRARQYEKDAAGRIVNAAFSDDSYKYAGSGMLSSSSDLAALGVSLLTDGFLDSTGRALLFTAQHTSSGESTGYGFGWFVDMPAFLERNRAQIPPEKYAQLSALTRGRRLIWHSGTANGATAMLLLEPSRKTVVAIVCNLAGIEPQLIEAAIRLSAQ
ncbi:MAG TPA: serine hydrolase domain-containing protein [Steroidobacteraceae bacterium]|jgi:CubicO group peptidase (beta-lactamase class C family)|nr:serine hydrolase domain-containing protein [Steroidobacteraceae bacterium]